MKVVVASCCSLELSINKTDIECTRTHQIGTMRGAGQKSRPIIVKFVKYNYRKNVFSRKKKLKGNNIAIRQIQFSFLLEQLFLGWLVGWQNNNHNPQFHGRHI